jgi:MerR family Zn(II)-responsive transcriptional regulator of zntA
MNQIEEVRTVYTRSEVSEKTGMGFDAIRYYERFGLLAPARGSNGYRQYGEDAIERLIFIKQAKKCGFTLKEIKYSLDLLDKPQNCNINTDQVIDLKIHEIDDRISELTRMKEMLLAVKEPLRLRSCSQIVSFNMEG